MNDIKSVIYRLLYNDRILKSNKQYEGLFEVWWSEENIFLALSCKKHFYSMSCNYRTNVFLSQVKRNNNIYNLYSVVRVVGILPNKY